MGIRDDNDTNTSHVTATLNIGGGTVTIGNIGSSGAMGQNNNGVGTGTATATLNVTGGTVGIGSISNMALNGGFNGTVTATLNFLGGTVTMGGDITRFSTSGSNADAILNLDGSMLDMAGNNIGGAGGLALDEVNLKSGTLKNVGEVNNGAAITKTTGGTLVLDGNNTYTGDTNIDAGILSVINGSAIPDTSDVTINGGALHIGTNAPTDDETIGGLTLSGGNVTAASTLTVTGPIVASASGTIGDSGTLDLNGQTVTVTNGGDTLTVTRNIVDGVGDQLVKNGAGTLEIGGGATLGGPSVDGIDILGGTVSITGGTVDLQGGNVQTNGNMFNLAGGILQNVDTIFGTLDQTGGTLINSLNSPDTMTITGDYNQTGGTFVVDIAGEFLGDYDIYDVGGTATLDGVLKINLLDGFQPGVTGVTGIFWDVLVADMITIGPNFSLDTSMAQFTSAPFRGWAYEIVDLGNGRFALRLFVTPEPASVLVWGVAGLAALLYARRRRWLPLAGGR